MPRLLVPKLTNRLSRGIISRDVRKTREIRWIQIVSKIKTQWSNWRLIAYPQANRVGSIIIIALKMGGVIETEILIGLVEAREARKHLLRPCEHVAHIVKNRKTDVVFKVWHPDVGKPHLQTIEEHSAAAYWETSEWIAGPRLI